jgi:hypothetical protein
MQDLLEECLERAYSPYSQYFASRTSGLSLVAAKLAPFGSPQAINITTPVPRLGQARETATGRTGAQIFLNPPPVLTTYVFP